MNLEKKIFLRKLIPALLVLSIGATYVIQNFREISSLEASNYKALQSHRNLAYDTSTSALPSWTSNLADVWDPMLPTDTPTFWYETKGGGTTISYTFSFCLGIVLANHLVPLTTLENTTVDVYPVGKQLSFPFQRRYVNVRTETKNQISECNSRNLLESELADVIFTPWIVHAGEVLFKPERRSRAFAMFRHPVKRVIDQFFYRQHATFDTSSFDESLARMTLHEFITSDKVVENFEVRTLLKIEDSFAITQADVQLAKEILRQKFLIGIFEWFEASMTRYEQYFGWWEDLDVLNNYTINNCHFRVVEGMDHVGNFPKVPTLEESENILRTRMWADIELYQYAKTLFSEQASLLP